MNRLGLIGAGFGLSLILLVACQRAESPGNATSTENEILEQQWVLVALDSAPVQLDNEEQRPHFMLQAEESRMAGFTGCNRMFGTYVMEGERLSFGPIGATKMACVDTMDLERSFLKAMEATASYYLTDGELELFDAQGENVARLVVRHESDG